MGENRAERIAAARPDMRASPAGSAESAHPAEGPQAGDAFFFLWGIYSVVAEFSPYAHSLSMVSETAETTRELKAAAIHLNAVTTVREAIQATTNLLRKVLPPGNKKEVYHQCVASRDGAPTASYKTFRRVWRRHFSKLLGRDRFL